MFNKFPYTSITEINLDWIIKKVKEALQGSFSGILGVENGGTGATTAEQARENLGIQDIEVTYPIAVNKGGTGATNASNARNNLGLGAVATETVVPILKGGTGASTLSGAKTNLGIPDIPSLPVPIAKGGTGATNVGNALSNLGLGPYATLSNAYVPLPINMGGTGGSTLEEAQANLGIGGGGSVSYPIAVDKGGTGATTAAAARTNLGLGSASTYDTVPISKGGTGSTTKAGARSNLGLGDVATENVVPISKGGTGATSLDGLKSAVMPWTLVGYTNSKGGTVALPSSYNEILMRVYGRSTTPFIGSTYILDGTMTQPLMTVTNAGVEDIYCLFDPTSGERKVTLDPNLSSSAACSVRVFYR